MPGRIVTKKRLKSGGCPKHFHDDKHRRDWKDVCVQDCIDRSPPTIKDRRPGKSGKCVRPKSEWVTSLLKYYQTHKKSGMSYKEAMIKFRPIYKRAKAAGRDLSDADYD